MKGYFLEKVLGFAWFEVSLPWLCTHVTMTLDFTKGIGLPFTNLGHTYLRIERKRIKPLMPKSLGGKVGVYVKKKKESNLQQISPLVKSCTKVEKESDSLGSHFCT